MAKRIKKINRTTICVYTYVSRTNPWPECQMFISHQSLGVCSCSLIGISNLTPLKPNSCFMPFPPKTKSISLTVFLSLYMAILSFLWSVTQTKITGVILDSPLSGKPYIQLISKFPCFCFQTTSGMQLPFSFFGASAVTLLVTVIITGVHLSIFTFLQFILNTEARRNL